MKGISLISKRGVLQKEKNIFRWQQNGLIRVHMRVNKEWLSVNVEQANAALGKEHFRLSWNFNGTGLALTPYFTLFASFW